MQCWASFFLFEWAGRNHEIGARVLLKNTQGPACTDNTEEQRRSNEESTLHVAMHRKFAACRPFWCSVTSSISAERLRADESSCPRRGRLALQVYSVHRDRPYRTHARLAAANRAAQQSRAAVGPEKKPELYISRQLKQCSGASPPLVVPELVECHDNFQRHHPSLQLSFPRASKI